MGARARAMRLLGGLESVSVSDQIQLCSSAMTNLDPIDDWTLAHFALGFILAKLGYSRRLSTLVTVG